MSEQVEEEVADPKARYKRFIERVSEDEDFIVDSEVSGLENAIMEYAEHPEQVKELFNIIADSIPIEKIIKKSGIDLEKEKELNEERTKEVLELIKKQIKLNKELVKVMSDLNKNIEIIEIFNKNIKSIIKGTKKIKKKNKEKRDPFEVIVPKNFWESILEDKDILSDE